MTAIRSITVENLQRLQNITVDFEETGVTAIMGANGTGKTTLLQALACAYRRNTQIALEQTNAQFSDYFKPHPGNSWDGSKYTVSFYGAAVGELSDDVEYSKNEGRWTPSTEHKKQRYVKFISISDCLPDQERETAEEIGVFQKADIGLTASKKRTLLESVSGTLHRQYEDAGYGQKELGLLSFFIVKTKKRTGEELEYPSHFMGSGEQKVFHIINEVLKAPRGALLLIEELDMFLHESAIRTLLAFLAQQANDPQRRLQIVFTTHWLGIQDLTESIRVFSLFENEEQNNIELRHGFDPQFIFSLNGDYQSLRMIKVWVEDGLAVKIVEQVAMDCGLRAFVDVNNFGSIQNAYTVAGAIAISGYGSERTLVVTDGDRYLTEGEKLGQIQNKVDGEGVQENEWRQKAIELIVDLDAPGASNPEQVLLDLCRHYAENPGAPDWLRTDLAWIERQVPRLHGKAAIHRLAQHKGMSMERTEAMFIQEASRSEGWQSYIAPVVKRLKQAARNVGLQTDAEE
ncbi:AAA family ATPase [Citrobacter werkmanii]|nr:AAA family ATPase [Citrobacter werkmanii]MBJ9598638.1 AAA family ATPase [Citrobacter werkmanii]HEB0853244.1 AAA family ATPase [Citrobacter freundii]